IEEVPKAEPDVLVLDLRMPEVSGLQVLEELGRRNSLPPTLILTTFDQTWELAECVRRGARGYLRKDVTLEQLVRALHRLAEGETFFHPALTERLLKSAAFNSTPDSPESLTARELEVMRLMAGGMSNREIAEMLGAAEETINHHAPNLLGKLAAQTTTQEALFTIHHGV